MIYYGLQIQAQLFFLPATLIICPLFRQIGSSWTTSAQIVGNALIGVGGALGF
jgi:hypothetical protein